MSKKVEMLHKSEIAAAMAEKSAKLNKTLAKEALEALEEVMLETLKSGKGIQLIGLMSISPKARPPRKGYNPLNKEELDIEAKVGVKLAAGKDLKRAVSDLDFNQFI
ncbi:HU family DNA-binding protein [Bacillus subtilis]|uniref:HU family DNA-binding protein n=1 Tax=Bacillus subtilis TaxID=1423 RepID=UPI0025C8A8CF|nr:HU family DNA-binding protein [Bacillus subtilis]WCS68061.1 DNA-binding protein HB1 [Bacillus phage vB_BsuM-Goe26]GLI90894.1 hypothetical protein ANABIO4_42460 [Bacillus subtilis]